MGEAELDVQRRILTIYSHFIFYGNDAVPELAQLLEQEIASMWNEPQAAVLIDHLEYRVEFRISSEVRRDIEELEVLQNTDPRNNYFRIEAFVRGNISFVDGLGSNTGFLLLENLYPGSTTAAHEYGHTLGLDHPHHLDLRGQGVPGIMYPRGTLVDPLFQYDPSKPAGATGGTMHPVHRKVKKEDIEALRLHRLLFRNNKAIVGDFTNVYHWEHRN
ncbi:MAG TPA: peptidase M10 [Flavisolibacter sp.]|nr:peptidase M10 [Flavisolibacter sp.]